MRDLHQELDQWTGYPPAWRPTTGDILVGIVEGYDVGFTPYGSVRTCMIVEEGTHRKYSIWLSSTVLLSLFERFKPLPGERLGLRYLGVDAQKRYHKFRLLVDRPQALDFSALGGEEVVDPDPA
jgi:hypothetical protein